MNKLLCVLLLLSLTGCSAFRELARQDREWQEQHKNDPPSPQPRCYYNMTNGQLELAPSGMSSMPVY